MTYFSSGNGLALLAGEADDLCFADGVEEVLSFLHVGDALFRSAAIRVDFCQADALEAALQIDGLNAVGVSFYGKALAGAVQIILQRCAQLSRFIRCRRPQFSRLAIDRHGLTGKRHIRVTLRLFFDDADFCAAANVLVPKSSANAASADSKVLLAS
jgi:hypothetical protein